MSDLRLEREFAVTAQRLYDWVSTPDKLLQWWGPEGIFIPEHDLNLGRTGPWYSVMQNSDGQRYKVSGQVTHVDPPNTIGFTWAWHDDHDQRGDESHVMFSVQPTANGSRLVVDHRDLGTDELARNHEMGWTSTLRKLDAKLN